MKTKLLILIISALLPLNLLAEQIHESQAREVVRLVAASEANLRSGQELSLVYTHIGESGELRNTAPVLYYLYNIGEDGFVIISGDDCFYPVIGYSVNGKYDADDLAPSFSGWMELIAENIQNRIANNDGPTPEAKEAWENYLSGNTSALRSSEVTPLIQTKWKQAYPYNVACPQIGGTRAPAGCVAVTMAQVMKYYEYPTSGTGTSNAYNTATNGIFIPPVDFSATTYEWDLMLDEITLTSPWVSTEAVSTLMYHCGVSVEMDYKASSSTGNITNGAVSMVKYFGYDGAMLRINASEYSSREWTTMLTDELLANRPVMYAGESSAGGHAFICDGLKNSLFHFNFGWGGDEDGYYTTNGIEYSGNMRMIIGVKPADEATTLDATVIVRPGSPLTCDVNEVNQGETFTVGCAYKNISFNYFAGSLAMVLTDMEDNYLMTLNEVHTNQLTPNYYSTRSFECVIPSDIIPGNYKIRAATKQTGHDDYTLIASTPNVKYQHTIKVTESTSSIDEIKNSVRLAAFNEKIIVESSDIIQQISVYDLVGRVIRTEAPNSTYAELGNISDKVVIVVLTINGKQIRQVCQLTAR